MNKKALFIRDNQFEILYVDGKLVSYSSQGPISAEDVLRHLGYRMEERSLYKDHKDIETDELFDMLPDSYDKLMDDLIYLFNSPEEIL